MSGIRGVGGATGSPMPRAARSTAGFRLAAPGVTAEAGGAAAVAPPPGLSLLALQETAAAAERDARARARGVALIAALAYLQAGLLRGRVDAALPDRLAALSEGEAAADPGLAALVADITLRARVELARLGHGFDVASQ